MNLIKHFCSIFGSNFSTTRAIDSGKIKEIIVHTNLIHSFALCNNLLYPKTFVHKRQWFLITCFCTNSDTVISKLSKLSKLFCGFWCNISYAGKTSNRLHLGIILLYQLCQSFQLIKAQNKWVCPSKENSFCIPVITTDFLQIFLYLR